MKIEEVNQGPQPVAVSPPNKTAIIDLDTAVQQDLSFLDMLASVKAAVKPGTIQISAEEEQLMNSLNALQPLAEPSAVASNIRPLKAGISKNVSVKEPQNQLDSNDNNNLSIADIQQDRQLLQDMLTPIDMDYLRQFVIPNLPILMGTVPAQSVFPVSSDGNIASQGFAISEALNGLIKKGYQTGQPFRIEINDNAALVIKIMNGRVSASFVSNDKAATMVMQQQLDELRQRLEESNLPVDTLEAQYNAQAKNQESQDGYEDQETPS
ncbi:MAG: hypothetical protein AAGI66_02705 [Cyanobacteria bacterium P01_H01_bin.74]